MDDTHIIRLSGTAYATDIPKEGRDYIIVATVSNDSQTKTSNHDGSYTIYHKFKLNGQELTIKDLGGTPLKAKAKTGSKSQMLRSVLWRLWERTGKGDSETFYQAYMDKIIENVQKKINEL